MNKLFNDPAFLVSSWSAIIFLSFAVGLLIQNRRLKKNAALNLEALREHRKQIERDFTENEDLRRAAFYWKDMADHNLKRAEEAEELRHQSAEAAAKEIEQLTRMAEAQLKLLNAANEWNSKLNDRNILLTRLLRRTYPPFRQFKNDNSKIEKHLAILERPKKRKGRAKVIKQAI